MQKTPHQYIERQSGEIRTERLVADRWVNLLYSGVRENSQTLFRLLTSARTSEFLGGMNFDWTLSRKLSSASRHLTRWGVDPAECLEDLSRLDTPRKVFERKIRYEQCRPLPADPRAVVSPADSRMLAGSFSRESALFVKDKFFDFAEMLGMENTDWLRAFHQGDFCVFRLTPEKYHYNHVPVSGRVVDFYELPGSYHSCNPGAVVSLVTPYSKNKRVVTVIDSDVTGGTGAGLVAMIEVVALMIGEVEQRYSSRGYEAPSPLARGMMLERGRPKSLFRPGSSTVVLVFQPGRLELDRDIVLNQTAPGVESRFCRGFGRPLVETEVMVRSGIGRARDLN